jgi:hypothetical protein
VPPLTLTTTQLRLTRSQPRFRRFSADKQPMVCICRAVKGSVKYTPDDVLKELWWRYLEALQRLKCAGKLGAVPFRFEPWIVSDKEG